MTCVDETMGKELTNMSRRCNPELQGGGATDAGSRPEGLH